MEVDGLRGTLFKVFGRGFTSRLSNFSSSSCFLTGSNCDEGDCIERTLRTVEDRCCGCGERWTVEIIRHWNLNTLKDKQDTKCAVLSPSRPCRDPDMFLSALSRLLRCVTHLSCVMPLIIMCPSQAPGSLFSSPAMPHSRCSPTAQWMRPNYRNTPCTGLSLALSSPLNMLRNG